MLVYVASNVRTGGAGDSNLIAVFCQFVKESEAVFKLRGVYTYRG